MFLIALPEHHYIAIFKKIENIALAILIDILTSNETCLLRAASFQLNYRQRVGHSSLRVLSFIVPSVAFV